MTAALDTMQGPVFTLMGACLCLAGVAGGWMIYTIRDDRRLAAEAASHAHRQDHSAAMCGASGVEVEDVLVSLDGHLFGLCPGCGKSHTPCSQIDRRNPFGRWVIDGHAPYIDPDYGLHSGGCWTNKFRIGDHGLCVCGRVERGVF